MTPNLPPLAAVLNEILPNNKIAAIKAFRNLTGASLKEAKDAIEQTPASNLGLLNPVYPDTDPFGSFVVVNDDDRANPIFMDMLGSDAEAKLREEARANPGSTVVLYRAVAEASCPIPEVNLRKF